jgi:hypothetical protein
MRSRWLTLLSGFMAVCFPTLVAATPANKKILEAYLGPFLRRPVDCRVCHLPDPPGTRASLDDADKPHNVFGARLKGVRKELIRAGKPSDLESRLEAIAREDSDGDGVSNLVELLTGHFPGDSNDCPTSAELQDIEKTLVAFARYQSRYRWQPFEPIRQPPVPRYNSASWGNTPIDCFLASARAEQGLQPRPEASKEVWLRRIFVDLTGLLPTRDERSAFLQDDSPNAQEKLVDRLLASPQYAERWARHWMDVWRYSDWAGYGNEVRESQPHIWHWRDWIIESLQADKGYDQMVREMLAGDELAPDDPNTVRATGFLVRNWFRFNRNVWLDQSVEHTAKAFLGVTLNCARCHDHKYDPFAQTEYYAFRAFFEPHQIRTDRVPGHPNIQLDGLPRVYDADLQAKTPLFLRGNEAMPDPNQICPPAVPQALHGPKLAITPISLPRDAYDLEQREFVLREAVEAAQNRLQRAETERQTAWRGQVAIGLQLLASSPGAWTVAPVFPQRQKAFDLALAELLAGQLELLQTQIAWDHRQQPSAEMKPGAAPLLQRQLLERQRGVAEARKALLQTELNQLRAGGKQRSALGEQVRKATAAVEKAQAQLAKPLDMAWKPPAPSFPSTSSGRRLALARWLTDPRNPLTARVAVNHVWLRHFGQPLVPTVFDFGKNGQPPTHPALLDWLAAEFMQEGWSLKKLHKRIVLSGTYRLDSTSDAAGLARDPDNRFYWRRLPLRLEAEAVRDSLLQLSGRLELARGGPELDQNQGLTTNRRSLFYRHANEKQMIFLTTFDAAGPTECYRRAVSVVPQQALALANSSLAQESSSRIARHLTEALGPQAPPGSFIAAGYEHLLGREPTAQEAQLCLNFLHSQENRLLGTSTATTTATQQARASLIHVLLNHHEFVTIR